MLDTVPGTVPDTVPDAVPDTVPGTVRGTNPGPGPDPGTASWPVRICTFLRLARVCVLAFANEIAERHAATLI